MRKFAANYLISENGTFLKNGIVIAEENGTAQEFIDTKGDLEEIAQLTFHNGILISGCSFVKSNANRFSPDPNHPFFSFVSPLIIGQTQLLVTDLIELGKHAQNRFPEMKIPEIWIGITEALQLNGDFLKQNIPGIFLLTGTDLVGLHFTQRSRLKKIL